MGNKIALVGGTVFDGISDEPRSDVIVTIDGNKIVDVSSGEPPRDVSNIIDCSERWIIPGLIDAHVHIGALSGELSKQHELYPTSLLALKIAKRMEQMLDCGYTTVRDAGGADLGFKIAQAEGLIFGPRLLISGWSITQTGGHGDRRKAAVPGNYHWDGDAGMAHVVADGVDAVRHAAREQIRKGADQIKVFASGGAMSPSDGIHDTQFSLDELKAAVEAAEASGRYVMAHALAAEAVWNCVAAGVRTIEHGNFLDAAAAAKMAEENMYLVPTLIIYDNADKAQQDYEATPGVVEKIRLAADAQLDAVRHAYEAGVKIGLGSDLLGPPALDMAREIALQAEVTGAPYALRSATSINAEILRIEDQVGTLEPGKLADLLVVDEDPLADPGSLANRDNLLLIMQNGRIHKNALVV